MKKTKLDLENEIDELKASLELERMRPTGHALNNCHIDMTKPDETKLAIAKAVKEGMKALQSLGGESYGIYFEGNKD